MRGQPDHRRFEALLREHRRIVFGIAGAYAHGAHERDDLAQEIVLQLWRSFRAYDERRAKFSTWMYRIALNVAISHARGSMRSGAGRCEPLDDVHPEALAWAGDDPHRLLERGERLAALHAFIERLTRSTAR